MKTKKIAIILIAIVFAVVVICAIFTTFTVKRVDAVFAMSEINNERAENVKNYLNSNIGKNLMFCNTEQIKNEIEKDPYVEIVSIVKHYPDVLEVSIKERKEVYVVKHNSDYYVLSENGLVLNKSNTEISGRNYIELDLGSVSILEINIGQYIKTDDDAMLATALEIAKTARLTDCVKKMKLDKNVIWEDVVFLTHTQVEIAIKDVKDEGKLKTEKAFNAYDKETRDYIKSNNKIEAFKAEDGNIYVDWTRY